MLTFSYTISPSLKREIEKIDDARNKILLDLVPRDVELKLRWEANLDRTAQASRTTDNKLKRSEVVSELSHPNRQTGQASAYFKAYQWIDQNWFLNPEKVELSDFKKLYGHFDKTNINEKEAGSILEFIQVKPEHAIVQAGLAIVLASGTLPQSIDNIKLSILLGILFLYKNGYDFRGLLNFEEFIVGDLDHFRTLLIRAYKKRELSRILEYIANGIAISAEHALRCIRNRELKRDMPSSFYQLTERQKEILTLFDKPGEKISNKNIQKKFKVSQITASRDLAKLHTLGLIFQGGRGRSVYYTKI